MMWRWYAFSLDAMRRSSRSQLTLLGVARRLAALAAHRLRLIAVVEHLEPHQLVDVAGGE